MHTSDKAVLSKYIPADAVEDVCVLLEKHIVQLKITNPRKHIHGSYRRPNNKSNIHQITVNGDLNEYSFLITLLHEFAHLHAWIDHKSLLHGQQWKNCFTRLIKHFIELNVFPDDIKTALNNHLQNIKSSDFMDIDLTKIMQNYDKNNNNNPNVMFLEEIPENTVFLHEGKYMEKQKLLSKYFLCKDVKTKRLYRCHPLMKVFLPENN